LLIDYLPKDAIRIGNSFFLCTEQQKQIVSQFEQAVVHAGTYLGTMKMKDFIPSVAFAERMEFPRITVDEKQAWLFLCGRDMFIESHVADEFVLICDATGAVLGIAKPQKKQLTNVWDKGHLLRREMRTKSK